jgi:hypothetical protein
MPLPENESDEVLIWQTRHLLKNYQFSKSILSKIVDALKSNPKVKFVDQEQML